MTLEPVHFYNFNSPILCFCRPSHAAAPNRLHALLSYRAEKGVMLAGSRGDRTWHKWSMLGASRPPLFCHDLSILYPVLPTPPTYCRDSSVATAARRVLPIVCSGGLEVRGSASFQSSFRSTIKHVLPWRLRATWLQVAAVRLHRTGLVM